MLVSYDYKLIFLKTHKTGGTSAEVFLQQALGVSSSNEEKTHAIVNRAGILGMRMYNHKDEGIDSTWFNHISAKELQNSLGEQIWDRSVKVCTIRNPFDRMISEFYWRHSRYNTPCFTSFSDLKLQFTNFVLSEAIWNDLNIVFIDDSFVIDRFIRFETLVQDLHQLCQDVGANVTGIEMPHFKNTSTHRRLHKLHEYYTAETRKYVLNKFAWVFEKAPYAHHPEG